jgi:hypothetical protein
VTMEEMDRSKPFMRPLSRIHDCHVNLLLQAETHVGS